MYLNFKYALSVLITSFLFSLFSYGQNNNYGWVKQVGGAMPQYAHAIVADKQNNTYTIGQFSGAAGINLDSVVVPLVSNGNTDIFILKQDPEGNTLWIKGFGGKGSETPYGITLDQWGGLYLTGSFADTVDFDPAASQTFNLISVGSISGFILKLDTAGNFKWALKTSSDSFNSSSGVTSIDADLNGNLYATGFYSAIASFKTSANDSTLVTNGGTDVFVYKLDTAANYKWAKSFGAAQYDYGYTVKADNNGNVYTVGMVIGEADFDPGVGIFNLNGGGGQYGGGGLFISKLDSNGNFVWAKNLGDNTNNAGVFANYFNHLNIDKNNDLIVTGWFNGTVDFDPSANDSLMVTANGSYDAFVAKYNPAGELVWAKKIGGSGADYGRAVTTDIIGNIYIGGVFRQTVVFDTATNVSFTSTLSSTNDVYIAKYTPDGDFTWAVKYGGTANEYISSITTDYKHNVYSSGNFLTNILGNTANFHTGNDTVARFSNGYDGYIHKMICVDTSLTNIQEVACNEYIYGDNTYTQSGIYSFQYWSTGGCDSTVILDLTVNYIDKPYITVNNFTLGITSVYASYQWIKNGVVISNATNATYDVTENANYRVVVTTTEGCTDTSDVYTVTNVTSIKEHKLSNQVFTHPNPVTDKIFITSPVPVMYSISSIEGKVLRTQTQYDQNIDCSQLSAGVYFIHLLDNSGALIKVEKIVKQQ